MNIKQKIQSFRWKKWMQRPFGPFMISLFKDGITKRDFKKIGAPNVECRAILFQKGYFYDSEDVWDPMVEDLERFLKKRSIFDVTRALEKFYKSGKKRMINLSKKKGDPIKQLEEFYEMMKICMAFVWMTHGLEQVYKRRLEKEVHKYVKGDTEKFIGDASFPGKKTMRALMEDAMRKGESAENISKRFGWMKARDGFSDPFTAEDVRSLIRGLKPAKKHPGMNIPKELKKLFKEMKELVFFRTSRTDVLYELIFLARPLLKRAGDKYDIPFPEIRYYTIQSLIKGKPERYTDDCTFASYLGNMHISEEPLIREEKIKEAQEVKGNIAYKGIARGAARIVRFVSELDKVKKGDVLVTQMTFPSYVSAMTKASAFVTDEGGITCHAAIVAREMKKPCITGTKIATKIFKDGDIIEVDANHGWVRIIKNNQR
ncbi:MAG: PEP-utilizing enzyme [Candidatus Woesearchaeota archaeon]|nr:PEP-utilizing enzyme [Candidatus Woesearchaeota archaeon]